MINTSNKNVDELINLLLSKITNILRKEFIGMYLSGSLALDDFAPDRSDIDLVVVTKNALPEKNLKELRVMHDEVVASKLTYSKRTECIYIPIDSLINYSQKNAYFPCLHVGGDFYVDGFGIIEKHILREKGKVISGPDPKSFIKPVNSNGLKKAALDSLKEWWLPQLTDHSKLVRDDYQVYAVLTMCRAFYTLQFGEIVSKSVAAKYTREMLDTKWTKLIEDALAWKDKERFNKLAETLDLIKFTLKKASLS